jgi:hypothetical protein
MIILPHAIINGIAGHAISENNNNKNMLVYIQVLHVEIKNGMIEFSYF